MGGGIYNLTILVPTNNTFADNSATNDSSSAAVLNLDTAPADNGGDTHTIALLTGSNAIDAGDALTCAPTDQRGVTRPQGAGGDVGAYELQAIPTQVSLGRVTVTAPRLPVWPLTFPTLAKPAMVLMTNLTAGRAPGTRRHRSSTRRLPTAGAESASRQSPRPVAACETRA